MTEQKNQDEPRQSKWFHEIAQQSKKRISFDDPKALRGYIIAYCDKNGWDCDLNHIDVSRMTSMDSVFENLPFTGDISRWDVSNVRDMVYMFADSQFNGDISRWDVSKVEDMSCMFKSSPFNGDISQWNLQNLKDYESMFTGSFYEDDHPNWEKDLRDQITRSQVQHQEENQFDETRGIHR